jgi:hypothetical protein
MPAGTHDAYCHEGGTVLEPRNNGRSVTATAEPPSGRASMINGMACAPVEEARR